jgi:hypothetical protein
MIVKEYISDFPEKLKQFASLAADRSKDGESDSPYCNLIPYTLYTCVCLQNTMQRALFAFHPCLMRQGRFLCDPGSEKKHSSWN